MVVLYIILILLVCFLVLLNVRPKRSRPTMFDVRHLLMEGEKELAVGVYCEIFHTTPAKARKDIEELQRSLKV